MKVRKENLFSFEGRFFLFKLIFEISHAFFFHSTKSISEFWRNIAWLLEKRKFTQVSKFETEHKGHPLRFDDDNNK